MKRIERFETIYKKICEDYQENHDRILFSDVVELHDIFREIILSYPKDNERLNRRSL